MPDRQQSASVDSAFVETSAGVGRARWYLNRLRCMSAAEIGHRVERALAIQAERFGFSGGGSVPRPDLVPIPEPWVTLKIDADPQPYLAAADRIAAGRLDVFTLRDFDYGSPPNWNRDPKTGIDAPLIFGKRLDYRNPKIVGDIKHLWEPNRHLQMVTLAQAYALSSDPRYANALQAQLESWFSACPYRIGPNWSSALEPALRLINWAIAWQLIGGIRSEIFSTPSGADFRDRWLVSIHQHVAFIRGYYSLYSSANNHLIGEAAGVFVAAASWPHWPETKEWLAEAGSILEREMLLQTGPDGVNREQAVHYQQFAADLFLLSLLAGRAAGVQLSAAFHSRLEAMLEYIAAIMDAAGHVPEFGDADEGYVVRLSQEPGFCPYRSLLATGALLFERSDFTFKAGALDAKTRWLLGNDEHERFAKLSRSHSKRPVRQAFPQGGRYMLGCDFETSREIRLVADAGPLGYDAIAAHGHADALAFTLSVGGKQFLIDPGTYTYRQDCPWRAYFRGTAAHNTIRIDGREQSEPGGNFMWIEKASAECTVWESTFERDLFEGWHDGYRRLPDPVVHRRSIRLDKRARRITIEDRIEASTEHDIELLFHCSEHCQVSATSEGYALTDGGVEVHLRPPSTAAFHSDVHVGSLEPRLGWASRRFGQITPAPTIRWQARLAHAVLRTEIDC